VKKAAAKDWQKKRGECLIASPIINHQLTVKQNNFKHR